jgi:hypothetical protein
MGTGRMNVPNGPVTPKGPPDERQRSGCQRKISAHPPKGDPAPGRKVVLDWQDWKAMRKTRTEQAPFHLAPRSLWSE